MPNREDKKGGQENERAPTPATGLLAFFTGLYILYKLFKPKQEVYYCPYCGHVVHYKSPFCWYCRVRLRWQSSPPKATMEKGTITMVFLGILVLLIILRFAIYPFLDVSSGTEGAANYFITFFGGMFCRDFGGYMGRTYK